MSKLLRFYGQFACYCLKDNCVKASSLFFLEYNNLWGYIMGTRGQWRIMSTTVPKYLPATRDTLEYQTLESHPEDTND